MRIVILTLGSRGDVQPYAGLALGLKRAGYSVCLAAPMDFEAFVRELGVEYAPVAGSFRALLDSPEGRKWMASGRNWLRYGAGIAYTFHRLGDQIQDDCWSACQGADAIVYSRFAYPGWHIAQKLGVPCACAHYLPPTMRLPRCHPGTPSYHPTRIADQWYERMGQQLAWMSMRRRINRWRVGTLELAPMPLAGPYREMWHQQMPYLFGYSLALLPRPAHWPDWYHITGFWVLDQLPEWRPPDDLQAYLDAGPPPVYVGFGSMSPRDPAIVTEIAVEALRRAGQRGVLQSGWAGIGQSDLPDDIFLARDIPHDWLFPRMAALVHHGGAGTAAASFRAGVPSIVTPFIYDQLLWAKRIEALGLGPAGIPPAHLTAAKLAGAIRIAVEDRGMRDRARSLSARIQAEDGVGRAVELLDDHLRSGRRSRSWPVEIAT